MTNEQDTPKVDLEVVQKEQYPSFELGSYGNSKIVKVTFDSVYVTSKHMAGGVSSIPFSLFSDDYGQYIITYDYMVLCSGLDISSLPLECVYRLENAYRLRFYKTYLNPVVEVVQGEIVESAEQVHNRICDNFAIVEKTLYEICVDLKSIRDNKHYKTLGYNTFEDYCLENFNMSSRNAYRFISIAENLSSDFVTTSSQIGLNKMYVLSRLTDEERSELIQTTDIENTPVKQLEQKSREIKENREVQVKENDVVSTAIEPQQIKEKEKDVPEAEKIVDILNMFQYFNGDTKEPCFCIYSNKFQVIKKDFILNDLLSYYEYLSKFKKLFDIDINSLTNTEFDALENVLSDFLEVSKRFGSCVYDLKQYLKEKKKELNKNG